MKSDLEALRQDLHEVYDGQPWHGSSIIDVLKGIDADVAARRSIPQAHTIWEIVLHMIRGLLQHHTYHEGQIAILKRAAISYSE